MRGDLSTRRFMSLRGWLWVLVVAMGGCASVRPEASSPATAPQASAPRLASQADPFESFNRQVFSFNEAVDGAVLKPVARGYRAVVPDVVQTGVNNVFGNVADAWSAANHLLQGKGRSGLAMTARFVTNTVVGVAGLVDVATPLGLEREPEDFGLTLGHWGLPAGPYVMLPLLGPSSLRDLSALPLDRQTRLPALVSAGEKRNALLALELIQRRADLLGAGGVMGQIALDRYVFVREAYLARRRSAVYDGEPPQDPDTDGNVNGNASSSSPLKK